MKMCCFGVQRLEYLGYIVTSFGITMDLGKTKAIGKYQPPTNIKELKIFIGMLNHYFKFVPQYIYIATLL